MFRIISVCVSTRPLIMPSSLPQANIFESVCGFIGERRGLGFIFWFGQSFSLSYRPAEISPDLSWDYLLCTAAIFSTLTTVLLERTLPWRGPTSYVIPSVRPHCEIPIGRGLLSQDCLAILASCLPPRTAPLSRGGPLDPNPRLPPQASANILFTQNRATYIM